MSSIAPLLDRNRAFAASGAHRDLGGRPRFPAVVLTCLDPRVEPAAIIGLQLADAPVLRNAGGRLTGAVLSDLAFMSYMGERNQRDGHLFELAIIQHTQCGSAALADPDFRAAFAERSGQDPAQLEHAAVTDPAATVAHDVQLARAAPQLSPRITVSGHVYDIATGLLATIVPATQAS